MRFLRRAEGLTKLDRVRNVDIRQRLKQDVRSYGSSENEAESKEGDSRWDGWEKTGKTCLQ